MNHSSESVHQLDRSKLSSKRHTLDVRRKTANTICDTLTAAETHKQLLAGCNPNAAEPNAAAVGAGGSANNRTLKVLTDVEWQKKREQYKDVACWRRRVAMLSG